MDMASIIEEVAKTYVNGIPLDTIKDRIKDIVTTYYKDNTFIVNIYLDNDYTHIDIYINLNNIPSFCINSNYRGRAIKEIVNYFEILGFKEIS